MQKTTAKSLASFIASMLEGYGDNEMIYDEIVALAMDIYADKTARVLWNELKEIKTYEFNVVIEAIEDETIKKENLESDDYENYYRNLMYY